MLPERGAIMMLRNTLVALVPLLHVPAAAYAQAYPSKPIRVITANSAGRHQRISFRALGREIRSASASRSWSRTAPAAA